MYAYLKGKFTFKNPAQVYVDINGVGYEVNISLNTYSSIQNLEEGKLYTYLQIKEDGHSIFGFFDKMEKELFILLIGVSGVGASTARMMLSSMHPDEINKAIAQGNVKQLESVKGIGKKTAERLVLELKDKIVKISGNTSTFPAMQVNSLQQDIINALMSLGISKNMADSSVQKIMANEPNNTNLEELIKKALKEI